MLYGFGFLIHSQNSQIKFTTILGCVFQIEKFIVIFESVCFKLNHHSEPGEQANSSKFGK